MYERVRKMKLTKIHTAGSDYLICNEQVASPMQCAKRLLDRKSGIGADALVCVESAQAKTKIRLFFPDGKEGFCGATAIIATAKYLYDTNAPRKAFSVILGEREYHVRLSVMGRRVLCAWIDMPVLVPRPLEQLKYYHGIRGEVLRACIPHPRVSIYELCGEHAVFMLESCAMLRALNIQSVCRRLEEVLFYGESIDLHFAAIAGDNVLSMRSWRCRKGETVSAGEGAVLCAYAAAEYETVDSKRIIVKTQSGSFCVELHNNKASLCAKCETVFEGEAI